MEWKKLFYMSLNKTLKYINQLNLTDLSLVPIETESSQNFHRYSIFKYVAELTFTKNIISQLKLSMK